MSLQREEQDNSPAEVVSVDHCCGLAQSRYRKLSRYHSLSLKRILATIEVECLRFFFFGSKSHSSSCASQGFVSSFKFKVRTCMSQPGCTIVESEPSPRSLGKLRPEELRRRVLGAILPVTSREDHPILTHALLGLHCTGSLT
jgi:hypothetical protein